MLVVKGVREDGLRELLAVEVADTESEATYEDLFRRLKDRGLLGVRLVTSDDHRGLVKAIGKHCQGVSWQRCQVHVARNALGKVARSQRAALAADVKAVFNAPTLDWARELKREVVERWARSPPKLAEWLETALEDALGCPRGALAARPQHQRPGALQPGAQAPDSCRADLPQPRRLPAARE